MGNKRIYLIIGVIGSASSVAAVLGAIITDLLSPKVGSIIMIFLLFLAWVVSVEIRLARINFPAKSRKNGINLKPEIHEYNDEPIFVHSREESPEGEIPSVDSRFLDWEKGTFCIWVKVVPELRKTQSNRYIFSHASDWRDNTQYPNAFCLYHSEKFPGWALRFHGDPKKEGDRLFKKRFISSQSDDGVRLFSIRWRKKQSRVEMLMDDEIKHRLTGFTNWPKPSNSPVFIGGWIRGGWDSYIKTTFFDVRIFNEWLSNDQISSLLLKRPDI